MSVSVHMLFSTSILPPSAWRSLERLCLIALATAWEQLWADMFVLHSRVLSQDGLTVSCHSLNPPGEALAKFYCLSVHLDFASRQLNAPCFVMRARETEERREIWKCQYEIKALGIFSNFRSHDSFIFLFLSKFKHVDIVSWTFYSWRMRNFSMPERKLIGIGSAFAESSIMLRFYTHTPTHTHTETSKDLTSVNVTR